MIVISFFWGGGHGLSLCLLSRLKTKRKKKWHPSGRTDCTVTYIAAHLEAGFMFYLVTCPRRFPTEHRAGHQEIILWRGERCLPIPTTSIHPICQVAHLNPHLEHTMILPRRYAHFTDDTAEAQRG